MDEDIQTQIEDLLANNRIVLFMKGTPEQPFCGYSARVVDVLDSLQVEYTAYNLLEDPQMREAIKEFTQWPTIPLLFIDGEFIGGCDITLELAESGELQDMLGLSTEE
ncbi:Grx4 family monothiol glutaredoxin [Candidatus Woesearchaeota archaeon]|nr:Grx4 family monothiol glutaredoxin [Nanoarchaeota archaeon]MCB9370763.1 Grx4 family monothiol glutaredoxin [Candidatus Woesearchaeota archaeon]USN43839.1 MAG: Grx4 family monothiol glutaredoxin [Candidatus Woesearchaeota archaeon]